VPGPPTPPPRLTVLGPGCAPDAVLGAFPASLRDRVTVVARTGEEGVIDAYRRHDMLVAPSTYEGFGMVVLEAMSQRLPVIATPVGCAPALVADGETGVLVPPRDGAALASAITRLAGDASLRNRLAEAGFQRVRGMTWRATALETLACYERALARGPRPIAPRPDKRAAAAMERGG
jgi:glycosyltransferase involved in cell wall biosynthesis